MDTTHSRHEERARNSLEAKGMTPLGWHEPDQANQATCACGVPSHERAEYSKRLRLHSNALRDSAQE